MTNPAYGKCYPFEDVAQQAFEAEWRHLAGAWGDGIVNDFNAAVDAYSIARSTSDRTLTLRLSADYRLRGVHFEPTTPTLALSVPTTPSGTRCDRVVAKFTPANKQVTFEVKPGVAVTSGTPTPPPLTQASGGVWEVGLWRLTGGNGAASTLAVADERNWIAGTVVVATDEGLNNTFPVGTTALVAATGHRWRMGVKAGALAWTDLDASTWVPIGLPSSVVAGGTAPAVKLLNGVVYWRGSWVKTDGSKFAPGGGTNGSYSLGTAPVGYRPGNNVSFAVDHGFDASATGARVLVGTDGVITAQVGPAHTITIGGGSYTIDGSTTRLRAENVFYPAEG